MRAQYSEGKALSDGWTWSQKWVRLNRAQQSTSFQEPGFTPFIDLNSDIVMPLKRSLAPACQVIPGTALMASTKA